LESVYNTKVVPKSTNKRTIGGPRLKVFTHLTGCVLRSTEDVSSRQSQWNVVCVLGSTEDVSSRQSQWNVVCVLGSTEDVSSRQSQWNVVCVLGSTEDVSSLNLGSLVSRISQSRGSMVKSALGMSSRAYEGPLVGRRSMSVCLITRQAEWRSTGVILILMLTTMV